MEKSKDFDQLIKMLQESQRLCEQKLTIIEPEIRQAMASGIQDTDYLERITDPLYDLVISSGIGRELYDEFLIYVKSFNPQKAKEYQDFDNEMNGVYDDLVIVAEDLAKEYHKGQVDKVGVDYFEGHLSTVGKAGENWKEQIVGYLHDVAEDTPHTVDEIVKILRDKSNGILKEEDAQEIKKALNLLNSNNSPSREAYIAGIKNSFIATKVKLNDLKHNIDLSRISNPTEKDMERTKRYRREYRQVLEYLGPVAWEWKEGEV